MLACTNVYTHTGSPWLLRHECERSPGFQGRGVCVSVCVRSGDSSIQWPWSLEEDIGSSGVGVQAAIEPRSVGAGN